MAFTLESLTDDRLEMACTLCGFKRLYSVASLIERFGNVELPDLLRVSAPDCDRPFGCSDCGLHFVTLASTHDPDCQ